MNNKPEDASSGCVSREPGEKKSGKEDKMAAALRRNLQRRKAVKTVPSSQK